MAMLFFKADDVRRVVEHALNSKQHGDELVKYDDDFNPITKPGRAAVLFVHDEGVYLMSNGEPRDLIENLDGPPTGSFCAYARGCNPKADADWYDTARSLVGGDDFGETLHWAEEIKQQLDAGATVIVLSVSRNQIELLRPSATLTQRKPNGNGKLK